MKFRNIFLMAGILVALGNIALANGMTTADFKKNLVNEANNKKAIAENEKKVNEITEKLENSDSAEKLEKIEFTEDFITEAETYMKNMDTLLNEIKPYEKLGRELEAEENKVNAILMKDEDTPTDKFKKGLEAIEALDYSEEFEAMLEDESMTGLKVVTKIREDIEKARTTEELDAEDEKNIKIVENLLDEVEPIYKKIDELENNIAKDKEKIETIKKAFEEEWTKVEAMFDTDDEDNAIGRNAEFEKALKELGYLDLYNKLSEEVNKKYPNDVEIETAEEGIERINAYKDALTKLKKEVTALKESTDEAKLVAELESRIKKLDELKKEKEKYEIDTLVAKVNPNGIVDKYIAYDKSDVEDEKMSEEMEKYMALAEAYTTYTYIDKETGKEENVDFTAERVLENRFDINENKARINSLDAKVNELDKKVDGVKKGISQVAAMTAVDFQDLEIGEIGIGAAVGTHDSTQSVAVGVGYAATANFKVNAKVAMTPGKGGKYTGAVGAVYKFQTR